MSEAGLTDAWLIQENFLWDEESQCLYIPVRQETNLVGYVQRYFAPKDYRTLALDKSNFFGYYRKEVDKLTDSVVIVEDVLSALRVSKFSDTIAVLGTNLPPQAVSLILRRYANVTIFLDADNPTVKRETRRMARKLPFVKVRLIETGKDPKRYSDEALKSLLTTE